MFDIGTFPVVVFSSRKTFIWFLVNTIFVEGGKMNFHKLWILFLSIDLASGRYINPPGIFLIFEHFLGTRNKPKVIKPSS